MKTDKVLLGLMVFLMYTVSILSQEATVLIGFELSESNSENQICFNIQVTQKGEDVIKLSTQNYRVFYDASQIRFLRQQTISLLQSPVYSEAKVIQAIHDSDASGYGNLDFSETLGFINFNINETGDPHQQVRIPHNVWLATSKICFERLAPDPIINLVWGRSGLTDGYATAFTKLAVSDSKGETRVVRLDYMDSSIDQAILRDKMAISDIKE